MSDEPIQYIINSTYKNLEQPYSEQHIQNINQPPHKLYVWDNQLLMNFQLYALNKQSTNAFEVNQLQFVSAYHAISWVCSRQLMRSDLTEEYRKYLVGKKYEAEVEIRADQKQIRYSDGTFRAIGGNNSKIGVAQTIGKEFGLAAGTVLKYGIYAQAVDRIMAVREDMATMILMGEIKISHKNILILSEQSSEAINDVFEYAHSNNISHIGYSALEDNSMHWAEIEDPIKTSTVPDEPMIRQMPKYDPDAEISSLALTIPSWISSMERANRQTNYSKTSSYARIKLVKQLAILERTIYEIQKEIEEAR